MRQGFTVAASVVTGIILIAAGVTKAGESDAFAHAVAAYGITPDTFSGTIAMTLPGVEMVTGICLCLRPGRRASALAGLMLCTGFCLLLTWQIFRGETADCGCLGTALKASPPLALFRAACMALLLAPGALRRHGATAIHPPSTSGKQTWPFQNFC